MLDPKPMGADAWENDVKRHTEGVGASDPDIRFCETWAKSPCEVQSAHYWEVIEAASTDSELLALSYHQQVSRHVQFCWCKYDILVGSSNVIFSTSNMRVHAHNSLKTHQSMRSIDLYSTRAPFLLPCYYVFYCFFTYK